MKKLSALLCLAGSIPVVLFAQPGSPVKKDTVYYRYGDKKIQAITETSGTKKMVTSYYQEGTIQSIQNFLNDKPDGTSIFYYPGGSKQSETQYEKGAVVKKQQWFQSGIVDMEENYKLIKKDPDWRSVLEGKAFKNFSSGKPMNQGTYVNGLKDGEWIVYYENGNKREDVFFKEGHRNGKAEYWFQSGKQSGSYNFITIEKNGGKQEVWDGLEITFYETGTKSEEGTYKAGKKEGLCTQWYDNGTKKSEIEYKDDMIHGKHKLWFQNGGIKQDVYCIYIYDSLKKYNTARYEGKYEMYHDNGSLKISGNYVNGKEEGIFSNYYENKQLSYAVTYKNGLKTGKVTYFNSTGKVLREETWVIVTEKNEQRSVLDGDYSRYLDNGTLVEKGKYIKGRKDGLWAGWFPDGKKANEINYCNGLYCGKYTLWDNKGTLKQENSYVVMMGKDSAQSFLDGEIKEYDRDGKLSRLSHYHNGKLYGRTEEYFEDGTLKSEMYHFLQSGNYYSESGRKLTYFSNGQLQSDEFIFGRAAGRTFNYYINGNLKTICDWVPNGQRVGYEIQWSPDGEMISCRKYKSYNDFEAIKSQSVARAIYDSTTNCPKPQGAMADGKKDGLWITWFDHTHKRFEEHFKNGIYDGMFTAYYPDGKKLLEMGMKDGYANGKFTVWYPDGKILRDGNYLDGIQTGDWAEYQQNGNKEKEYTYKTGEKPYSYYKEWWPNGNPRNETHYADGKQDGYYASWYENGKLYGDGYYANGKIHGESRSFYENGQQRYSVVYKEGDKSLETDWNENGRKTAVIQYVKGKKNGHYTGWWPNGNIRMEGNYVNDEQDSTWNIYLETGKLDRKAVYKNGILEKEPTGFACECVDTTKNKLGFAPLLTDLATLNDVHTWSFNFHAPIGEFYNHLFFVNLQNSHSERESFFSFDIVSYRPMFLSIPDDYGIKLVLNPCVNLAGKESRLNFYINVSKEDKQGTRATLETKYLSLEFNAKLLHQWDKKTNAPFKDPKGVDVPSALLFKAERVEYNERDHLKLEKVKEPCFPSSEIGSSGIVLDFKDMTIDLDVAKVPDAIKDAFPKKYYEYFASPSDEERSRKKDEFMADDLEHFTGIFIPAAKLTIPAGFFENQKTPLEVTGNNLMISGQYVVGTLALKASIADGLNYLLDIKKEQVKVSAATLEQAFKKKGFQRVRTEYDPDSSVLNVYFYYATF